MRGIRSPGGSKFQPETRDFSFDVHKDQGEVIGIGAEHGLSVRDHFKGLHQRGGGNYPDVIRADIASGGEKLHLDVGRQGLPGEIRVEDQSELFYINRASPTL